MIYRKYSSHAYSDAKLCIDKNVKVSK